MLTELSAFDQVVEDAQADKELTVPTDSLSSMQTSQSPERRYFRGYVHGHDAGPS